MVKKYDISIGVICPPERQKIWAQQEKCGYSVTLYGHTVRLEGKAKTEEDFMKLLPLIRADADHHIVVKEVMQDGEAK